MEAYQHDFIALALQCRALQFGRFTLKSGRVSPYFFNAGAFNTGAALARLGRAYAARLADEQFDILFGPAYKGIPLAVTTATALADQYGRDVPVCFNRKEAKDHGEGGHLIGAPLAGRVMIIDDVITAGTAVREVLSMLSAAGASPAGIVIGLDRQERGRGQRSAIEELENETGVAVKSLVKLSHILDFVKAMPGFEATAAEIEQYRHDYGV